MRLGQFLTERLLFIALEELVNRGIIYTIGEPSGQHAAQWRMRGWTESQWLVARKRFVPKLAVKVALAVDEMVAELKRESTRGHRFEESTQLLVVAEQLAGLIHKWLGRAAERDKAYCLPK